jgi:hypothetical protein
MNYIAIDRTGEVYGYECEPYRGDDNWYEQTGAVTYLGRVDPSTVDFENSLLDLTFSAS